MVALFLPSAGGIIYLFLFFCMGLEEQNVGAGGEKEIVKVGKNIKLFFIGLGGLVVAVLVLAVFTGVVRVYAFGATDKFTVTVARILRLPVAKINGTVALYTDYAEDLHAITIMRNYDKANKGPGGALTDQEMSDQVLLRLANNALLDEVAPIYGVTVEAADIDSLKANLLQQFQNVDELNTELKKRYGWTLADYEKKVMRSFVLQGKLSEKLAADEKLKAEIKDQAQKVLDQAKGGADFAALATQYGQDGTKDLGGDLGFFKKGELAPEFENAAFALKAGEVTPKLVETQYGYHIIKLEERKIEEQVNSTTKKKEKVESVRARHILFRYPSIDVYLGNFAKQSTFHLYPRIHNPFTDLKK